MTSALTNRGSTRRWRQLRAHYATTLPQPCPYCAQPVTPTDTWHLDHATPRKYGGTDATLRPAHAHCNQSAGARLPRPPYHPPSRQW